MRVACVFPGLLAAAALAGGAEAGDYGPGYSRVPGMPPAGIDQQYPGAPRPQPAKAQGPPDAMNYGDEVARALGIRNGQMEFFTIRPGREDSLAPVLTGGVNGHGATLKLQWRQ